MATTFSQFSATDPLTGDMLFPPSKVDPIASSQTGTIPIRPDTVAVLVGTDSSAVTYNLEATARAATTADMAPPARGAHIIRLSTGRTANLTLSYTNT